MPNIRVILEVATIGTLTIFHGPSKAPCKVSESYIVRKCSSYIVLGVHSKFQAAILFYSILVIRKTTSKDLQYTNKG